jgi:hypothetical protein
MIVARHEVPGLVRRDALLTSRHAVPACYPKDKIPGQPRVNPVFRARHTVRRACDLDFSNLWPEVAKKA